RARSCGRRYPDRGRRNRGRSAGGAEDDPLAARALAAERVGPLGDQRRAEALPVAAEQRPACLVELDADLERAARADPLADAEQPPPLALARDGGEADDALGELELAGALGLAADVLRAPLHRHR